jgi:hypothetical protein
MVARGKQNTSWIYKNILTCDMSERKRNTYTPDQKIALQQHLSALEKIASCQGDDTA